MSVPADEEIAFELLRLLSQAPVRTLECSDVYEKLARKFPQLTSDEINRPYQHSISLWANRVQWVRQHCVENKLIHLPNEGIRGYGFWTLTDAGFNVINAWKSVENFDGLPLVVRQAFRFRPEI